MLQRVQCQWPPDYAQVRRARRERLEAMMLDPVAQRAAMTYYRTRPTEFIEDWCDTFDPRNAGTGKPTTMPFVLFPRQREFVEFLHLCYQRECAGLVEKSRDVGATWLCVSFSVWMFLFVDGARIGWGSRKAANVDKIGDMDSIFEKIRFQMRTVPRVFWPPGFGEDNMAFMKVHAKDGRSITGESGDDIGRGGRTRIYFKDESAHYEHPESIEAALSDTTRVQFDLSSVCGLGNVFHRKREGGVEWEPGESVLQGKTNVFVMDWSDHPDKTRAWYDERESLAIDAGLLHVFRQEVDRNYAASVDGVVVPAEWVRSAIDAHVKLGFVEEDHSEVFAGLDVADGGGDRNALALRRGVVLRKIEQWGERDTGVTTRRAVDGVAGHKRVHMQYDCIGVGAGVKAEANRLADDGTLPKGILFSPWNAGAKVLGPDDHVDLTDTETPLNKDFYQNLKAQGWWQLRRRFEKTHRAVEAKDPKMFPHDELISIDPDLPLLRTLQKELSQPTAGRSTTMKLLIEKQPEGTRSPNLADAVVMCYFPVDSAAFYNTMEWV
jgi:hypothetical protein